MEMYVWEKAVSIIVSCCFLIIKQTFLSFFLSLSHSLCNNNGLGGSKLLIVIKLINKQTETKNTGGATKNKKSSLMFLLINKQK